MSQQVIDASAPVRDLSERRATYGVFLLFCVYTYDYIDRHFLSIAIESIKVDLQLHDWQIGLLGGFAVSVIAIVPSFFISNYSDRSTTHRNRLLAVSIALWSVMTSLTGAARNFAQLLLFRLGFGLGEASCHPTARALIADMTAQEKRVRAMSLYAMGIPTGKLVGLIIGGAIVQYFGWRIAFYLVGIPGLMLAILAYFTLPEPRTVSRARERTIDQVSFWHSVRDVLRIRTFWLVNLAGAFLSFMGATQNAFIGAFLIRVHGLSTAKAGLYLGLALGAGGMIGTWLSGQIVDRLAVRDLRNYTFAPAVTSTVGSVLLASSLLAGSWQSAIVLLAFANAFNQSWHGAVFATTQGVVPKERRATAATVQSVILSLLGIGLGPLFSGILSDALNHGFSFAGFSFAGLGPKEGLRYALALSTVWALPAIVLLLVASKSLIREYREAR